MINPIVDQTLQGVIRLIVPEAALVGTACVLFMVGTLRSATRKLAGLIALGGLGLAEILHFCLDYSGAFEKTVAPILFDTTANFLRLTAIVVGAILVLVSWNDSSDRRSPEYHACLLCVIAGLSLVGLANDLIILFLALELISIPTYIMLYLPKCNDAPAQEAAVKYFLLSILSSAMLLFGFSYLYGITGTTNITAILRMLPTLAAGDVSSMALVSAVMVVAGLGFRITAFPFHFYAPDVYQGGPTGAVAMLAVVPKIAGFVALIRLYGTFSNLAEAAPLFTKQIILILWILAAITMTAGNVLALLQNNVRRMLAYSGVAHGGYMLIGLALLPTQVGREFPGVFHGGEAVLFYLIAYGAMTIGMFAVLSYLSSAERLIHKIDDLSGLHESHPRVAFMAALFLFSMIGLPATAGFLAKFRLIMGALGTPDATGSRHLYQILAVVAVVNAAIAAYYYLRVVGVIYLRGSFDAPRPVASVPVMTAMVVCAVVTVLFGVYPAPLWNAARAAFGGG